MFAQAAWGCQPRRGRRASTDPRHPSLCSFPDIQGDTRRRQVIAGLAGLLAAPRRTIARHSIASGRIGFLHPRTVAPNSPTVVVLRSASGETRVRRTGLDHPPFRRRRSGETSDACRGASGPRSRGADRGRARGIGGCNPVAARVPVVAIDLETDPVRSGLAASFSRPGGNVTGLFVDQPSITGKWVELLREAVPGLERVALISEADGAARRQEAAVAAAQSPGAHVYHAGNRQRQLRKCSCRSRWGLKNGRRAPLAAQGFRLQALPRRRFDTGCRPCLSSKIMREPACS